MTWSVPRARCLRGSLRVPGDKSISHRSLMFGALAVGPSRVRGLLRGEDVLSTRKALAQLGIQFDDEGDAVVVRPCALRESADVLDCGNSGTTIRLLSGILARQPFLSVLTGDGSLRRRPMARVLDPLRELGVHVDGRDNGRLPPLVIRGRRLEQPGHFDLAISSAQVKSALLLAGFDVGMVIREPRRSRDHTERMLGAMGAPIRETDGAVVLDPVTRLDAVDVDVPADISSAAFWLAGAAIHAGSRVELADVGLNPTRTGVIDALRAMGARIDVSEQGEGQAEPRGHLCVEHQGLRGTRIDGELALRCLDELPVLAVAAAFAEGETVIADAGELRVKESDRIARTVAGLRAIGAEVEERPDGMVVAGGLKQPGGGLVDATGDHRIAMAFAVAGLAARDPVQISGAESIATSYPAFHAHLEQLTSA